MIVLIIIMLGPASAQSPHKFNAVPNIAKGYQVTKNRIINSLVVLEDNIEIDYF